LVIDGNITVEVAKIYGNRISLGIVASSNVKTRVFASVASYEGSQVAHRSSQTIQSLDQTNDSVPTILRFGECLLLPEQLGPAHKSFSETLD
jgi:sRNA-binding carbon storage regulator CsrA